MTEHTLTRPEILANRAGITSLASIALGSLSEFRRLVKGSLSFSEATELYRTAQQEMKANRIYEAKLLTRASPLLRQAVHLGIRQNEVGLRSYEDQFGNRAARYTRPGAVSSMFSPAGYLTELYREARELHASGSPYNIDTRRPDLKELTLNQENLDQVVPALVLCNEALMARVAKIVPAGEEVQQYLATFRHSAHTPYHAPYTRLRQCVQQKDPTLTLLNTAARVVENMQMPCAALAMDISPEDWRILKEDIKPETEEALFTQNFGERITAKALLQPQMLMNWYDLTEDEARLFVEMMPEADSAEKDTTTALKVNKLIRLWRATGVHPYALGDAVNSLSGGTGAVTESVLESLCFMTRCMQHYNISAGESLALCAANITTSTVDGNALSQFNQLFNDPPLNGFHFEVGGADIDLAPSEVNDPRRDVLKRAFGVDDVGLNRLLKLYDPKSPDKVKNNITVLSGLYRVMVLAKAHALTVVELGVLWQICDEDQKAIGSLSFAEMVSLTEKLHATQRWLAEQKWTVHALWAMTTAQPGSVLTPEISSFIDTLKMVEVPEGVELPALALALAPAVAAAMQLSSQDIAVNVLTWVNGLKPGGMTLAQFWDALQSLPDSKQLSEVIAFCYHLAQRALVVRAVDLNASALKQFVTKPESLWNSKTLGVGADTLLQLSRFTQWLNGLGESASGILSQFIEGTLTPAELANAMKQDEVLFEQAAEQAALETLTSWADIDVLLQWVNLSATFGVAPATIDGWLKLDYKGEATKTWEKWQQQALSLQAGLTRQEQNAVEEGLLPRLSSALCGALLNTTVGERLSSREQLYQYMLLDNLNGAQVKTTRIAEAISSLQLYVHRALNGQEPNVAADVSTRQFFSDWTQSNSRYSTWAGFSKLAYYPENYTDPTVRLGQTGLMNEMLQKLGQAQLNTDTVGDAFHAYLSGFEEVANLKVVSGYHDNLSIDEGKTYFIGESQSEPREFYWRSVDEGKRAKTGGLPANAWTDWKKVGCAPTPWADCIRPVMFKSRLHLCWLERTDTTPPKADGTPGSTKVFSYTLKVAYVRYDGNWSTPRSYDVSTSIRNLGLQSEEVPGLYCASHVSQGKIIMMWYKKEETEYGTTGPTKVDGASIVEDLTFSRLDETELARYPVTVRFELDRSGTAAHIKRVNNTFEYDDEYTVGEPQDLGGESPLGYELTPKLKFVRVDPDATNEFKFKLTPSLGFCTTSNTGDSKLINKLEKHGVAIPGGILRGGRSISSYGSFSVVETNGGKFWSSNKPPLDRYKIVIGSSVVQGQEYHTADQIVSYDGSHTWYDNNTFQDILFYLADNPVIPRVRPRCYFVTTPVINDVRLSVQSLGLDSEMKFAQHGNMSASRLNYRDSDLVFNEVDFVVPLGWAGERNVNITFETGVTSRSGETIEYRWNIPISRKDTASVGAVKTITTDADGAQYMQMRAYRTRLNTLFARQLVARAANGIDSVLNYDTQMIKEPRLGRGGHIKLTLPPYNEGVHGTNPNVIIGIHRRGEKHEGGSNYYFDFWEGRLTNDFQSVTLFLPYSALGDGEGINFPYDELLMVRMKYEEEFYDVGTLHFDKKNGDITSFTKDDAVWNEVRDPTVNVIHLNEPMDFSGANALYFWELFYYTPMMVAQRMLQEQRFDEAQRWLSYVWNPAGYVVQGKPSGRTWNVRPLQEDTSWNANPLDSVDPDAVSQNDPMHYKLSVFMRTLDLLMARGDTAYRRLERDTLNEAKMWYSQALNLLGERAFIEINPDWNPPKLSAAAGKTIAALRMDVLSLQRKGLAPQADTLAGNSLLDLFLPEVNDVLYGYWDTLALRMFNLRHNLTLDGQPMSLAIYATPADPKALQSAAVAAADGGGGLRDVDFTPQWRFTFMLDSARGMVSQLIQTGQAMQSVIERQDAEALNELLQTQASELMLSSLSLQDRMLMELDADRDGVLALQEAARTRRDHYKALCDENVSARERSALDAMTASQSIATGATALHMAAAAADLVPNIFGLAAGGMKYGGLFDAAAIGLTISSQVSAIVGGRITQEEHWVRRWQDWDIQRKSAEKEIGHLDAQLVALDIRRESAVMQKTHLETQQAQLQAQLTFLQRKFSNQALYSWLRGRLATVFFQFYDLTVSRCLMAEKSYRWETGRDEERFIKPGAWQGTWAGLSCGETLMAALARMEDSFLQKSSRALEVRRTVSLAQVYASLPDENDEVVAFALNEAVTGLVNGNGGPYGTDANGVKMTANNQLLAATVTLSDLKLKDDYPHLTGVRRRIKQVSVSLPALLGPYQDIQAELSYTGGKAASLPKGGKAIAVSHGVQDDGLLRLDFGGDAQFLPFEGLSVDDEDGRLTLSFPNPVGKQKALLKSLNDIILHISYTIRADS